jgi:hypothetical protein
VTDLTRLFSARLPLGMDDVKPIDPATNQMSLDFEELLGAANAL